MNEYVKSDLYRYYGEVSIKVFLIAFLKNNAFRYMVGVRLSNSTGIEKIIGMFLYIINRDKSIKIHRKTKIGYGLYIGHGGPVVINPNAIIGDNVNLSQFTTIGSSEGKAAVIGDNCYIGPNVCIVEDVKIGNNVTIGAGSVVTKDIPENATAAGNYAKVLNYNNPGRYVGNRWTIEKSSNK